MNKDNIFHEPEFFKTLGISVYEMADGKSRLGMPFDQKLTIPYEIVHGGAIFSLADSACGLAVASIVKDGKKFVAAEMKINFIEPVYDSELLAEAEVLRQGRVIPVEAKVFNKNVLVAKAIATYIILNN